MRPFLIWQASVTAATLNIVSFVERLDRWRREKPDALAVVDYDIVQSKSQSSLVRRTAVTTAELWRQVLALAAALRTRGIGRGDVVSVQLPNWHEFFVAHLALYTLGAVTSPVSPIYRKLDLARQIGLSGAKALIVPAQFNNFDYAAMAMELRAEMASLRDVIVVGNSAPTGASTWAETLAAGSAPALEAERTRLATGADALPIKDMVLLNFTSGTTGQPKGVMHTTHSLSSCVLPTLDRLQLNADDVVLVAPTLGHGAGFLNGMYVPLHLGATVVYMDAWDARFAAEIIEREGVTYGPVMPTYLFDLVGHLANSAEKLATWKTGRVSGGAIPRPLMATLQARLPQLRLCPGWGMSENLYSTCGSPDDRIDKRNFTEGNTVGDCVIEIRDATFTHSLPAGEVGEIVTRGSSLCIGYYKQEELTRQSYTTDGWFKTGDLGRLDAEGYLTLVGRSKDLIIRGGENVPVVEVEQLLTEHPDVAEAVIVGIPDARLGEKVCALLVMKKGASPLAFNQMSQYLTERRLTRHFIPEYLLIVDSLPRTAIGKIKKQEARSQALARLDTAAKRQH